MKMKDNLSQVLALINELNNPDRVTVLTALIAVMPHDYLTLDDIYAMVKLGRWKRKRQEREDE